MVHVCSWSKIFPRQTKSCRPWGSMRRPDGSERSVCPVVDIRLVPTLCLEISEPLQEVAVHFSVMKRMELCTCAAELYVSSCSLRPY